jgi:hypothetical protein
MPSKAKFIYYWNRGLKCWGTKANDKKGGYRVPEMSLGAIF